jgi:PKD repeat protein
MRALSALQAVGFFSLTLLIAAFLVDRVLFEAGITPRYHSTPDVLLASAAIFASGLVAVTLSMAWALAPDLRTTALDLDRRASAGELFVTALEGPTGVFGDAVQRRAAESLRDLDLCALYPMPRTRYLAPLLAAVVGGSVLLAFPGRPLYAPRADFGVEPARGTAPLTVSVFNGSCGHIDGYLWEWGDGSADGFVEGSHTFAAPGEYVIGLRATGPMGKDTRRRTVRVLAPDQPVARFRAVPSKGRAPLEVRFENLSQAADRFEWDFGDGVISQERSPSHLYKRPGRYVATLLARSGDLQDRATAPVLALHPDGPLADFAAIPTEGEAPLKVNFESRSTGQITEFEWDVGDFYSGSEAAKSEKNPEHEYRVPGVYTVRLKVRGPHGEDEEIKERYIRVGKGQGGGGGGGQKGEDRQPGGRPPPPGKPSQPGSEEGELFGPKSERPKVTLDPKKVTPLVKGEDLVEKVENVYTPESRTPGSDPAEGRPLKEVFPYYERQAEESILRERIPADSRRFVRDYFDRIRPREP